MNLLLMRHSEVLVFRNSAFAIPLSLSLLGRAFGQDFFAAWSCCLPLCSTDLLASWEPPPRTGRALRGMAHRAAARAFQRNWEKELL